MLKAVCARRTNQMRPRHVQRAVPYGDVPGRCEGRDLVEEEPEPGHERRLNNSFDYCSVLAVGRATGMVPIGISR